MEIGIKRVYESADDADGLRVLVDRLWPRGLSRERAAVDEWWRVLAPSDELRRFVHGDRSGWEEFKRRYELEVRQRPAELERAVETLRVTPRVTLLFAARDAERNNAVALRDLLLRELAGTPSG